MASPLIITGSVFEDGGASLMARIVGNDAANITRADTTSISRSVYVDGTIQGTATAIVVADSVFDALQTDARWSVDTTGYNFRDDVAASVFATGDTLYRLEYKFTPATGEVFWVVYQEYAVAVHTS